MVRFNREMLLNSWSQSGGCRPWLWAFTEHCRCMLQIISLTEEGTQNGEDDIEEVKSREEQLWE